MSTFKTFAAFIGDADQAAEKAAQQDKQRSSSARFFLLADKLRCE
jgi:hypothetical protein